MAYKVTRIAYSNLDGVFPSGYTDVLYTDSDPIYVGLQTNIFKTEPVVLTTNSWKREHNIQTIGYPVYELRIFNQPNNNLHLIEIANTISLQLKSGESHEAYIIDKPDVDRVQGYEPRVITIRYVDMNRLNFNGKQPVNNLLTHEKIKADIANVNLTVSQVAVLHAEYVGAGAGGGKTTFEKDFYTLIKPLEWRPEVEEPGVGQLMGIDRVPTSIGKIGFKCTIYCTNDNVVQWRRFIETNGQPTVNPGVLIQLTFGGNTYTAIERIKAVITENKKAIDLFKIEFVFIHDSDYVNHY
jgi:hypothetical protein